MDWDGVIERNTEALKRILAMLVAMAGLAVGPHPEALAEGEPRRTLPRHLHRAILALLRPAEAAARRLVIVVARDRGGTGSPPRPRTAGPRPRSIFVRPGKGTGLVLRHGVRPGDVLPDFAPPHQSPRVRSRPLLDPLPKWPVRRRRLTRGVPRISAPGVCEPDRAAARRPPLPDDAIDATRLALRLEAVGRVLDDLPAHARRFARWRMRAVAAPMRRIAPLRPGRPPGARRKPTHEVHEVLKDLHYFAFWALRRSDSS